MAVPGSGAIHMKGLHNEKANDDYANSSDPGGAVTMHDLVNGGNSQGSAVSYEATNTSGDNEPNTSTPHAFNEWYSYDHDFVAGAPSVPTISISSSDTDTLTLTWDMASPNQRVYFYITAVFSGTTGPASGVSLLKVEGDTFKTSAGSADLMQTGGNASSYNSDTVNIPATGYPNSSLSIESKGYFNGSFSAACTDVVGTTRPATPTSLAASGVTTTGMTIGWTAPTNGANSYTYYHGTNSSVTSNSSNSTTNTSVALSGLTPNQIYYFAVEAVGTGGTGVITSTTSQYTKASMPHSMSTTNITNNSATLNWSVGAGNAPNNFSIYAGTNGAFPNASGNTLLTSTQTGTSRNQTAGVTGNTTFYWWIQANATVASGYTSSTSFLSKPDAPTSPSVTPNTNTQVTLGWTEDAQGAASYTYTFGTDSDYTQNSTSTATSGTTSVTKTGLTGNTTYYFAIAGVNATGTGPYTSTASGLTVPGTIDNSTVTLEATDGNSFRFNFTPPTGGSASYVIKTGGAYNAVTNVYGTEPTSVPFNVDLNIYPNTQMFFSITTKNATGEGGTISTFSSGGYLVKYSLSAPPTGVSNSSVQQTSVTISWSHGAYSSTSSYRIHGGQVSSAYDAGSNSLLGTASSGATSATISGLTASTTYYVWVQAVNPDGEYNDGTVSTSGTSFTTTAAPTVTGTTQRGTGSGRSISFSTDTNGEIISSTGQAGTTANLESSMWRVVWTGADAAGTSAITLPSGPTVKQASSAASMGSATYTSSPGTLTMTSSKHHYFQLKESITYMMGMSNVVRNIVVTNNSISVTVPINWQYTGQVGASDRRLKTDIKKIGTSPSGIPIYEFRFKDDLDTLWEGTIAQDLLEMGINDVVGTNEDGFYTVDYDKIDVDQIQVIEIDGK